MTDAEQPRDPLDLAAVIAAQVGAPKPWWQSRAIVGALVVLAAQLVRIAGWEIDSEALTDAILSGLTLLGAALAWWGRVAAHRPISRRVAPGVGDPGRALRPIVRQPRAALAPRPVPAGRRPVGAPAPLDDHSA